VARVIASLENHRDRGLLLVRAPARQLVDDLRDGTLIDSGEYGRGATAASSLDQAGIGRAEVRVPGDTMRVWLDRAGIATRGDLVGWLAHAQ